MSGETFDVYFSGAIIKDNDPADVKRKIGAVFKLQGEKLDRLFSGKPIPIKKGIDMDRAIKFRVTFRDAGGLVDIVPAGEPPPTPKPAQPRPPTAQPKAATADSPQAGSGLTLVDGPMEPAAESLADTPPIAAPQYELSSAQGFDLSDCTPSVEPVEIPDISSMDMEKPGSTLDETTQPLPLEIDTSALELDKPGVTLIEEPAPAAPEIDTTDLTMAPANQGSLEDCQTPVEPVPIPNIDHLNVVQPEQASSQEPRQAAPQGKAKFKIADD